ncbi:T-cell-specific surface glycoprotein CD28 isoform X2 [Neoarius graeffei]|uniref:T-cell-specific surface glycoprotein CD28 isoform X2 n=1 Tax=Neoarius graeffei TaxID=443677 RepID=UPI00298C98BE|nr:T-cell-specific surface glycoprotein CD28 isoform X2 [Neoarius graeffei]
MIAFVITLIVGLPLGHAFSVSQPYYAVGRQGQVSLHCTINTRVQPEEMQVSVYKGMHGEEKICSAHVNTSNSHIETNGSIYCRGNVSTDKVDLTIFGLTGEDTDLYRCEVEIIFPPPYIKKFGNGTLVYIPDSPDCPPEHTQARIQEIPKITYDQTLSFTNILLFAILITTTITLILQVMKMILLQRKSNHLTQTFSQKGDYKNFW